MSLNMKKLHIRYLILFVLSISLIGCSKNNGKRIIDGTFIYGKVKSISYSLYYLERKFGEDVKNIESIRFSFFDQNTNLIKDSIIYNDILDTKSIIYKYNSGNLIEKTIMFYDKVECIPDKRKISFKTKYEFDSNNYLIKEISITKYMMTKDNTFLYDSSQINYTYSNSYKLRKSMVNELDYDFREEIKVKISHLDNNKRITQIDSYDGEGKILGEIDFTYNKEGLISSYESYKKIIGRVYSVSYFYDNRNNLIESHYNFNPNLKYTYENFDKHGNWLNLKIYRLQRDQIGIIYGENWVMGSHPPYFVERKIEYYNE